MDNNENIVRELERIIKENQVQIINDSTGTYATKNLIRLMPDKKKYRTYNFTDLFSLEAIIKQELHLFSDTLYVFVEDEKRVVVFTTPDADKERETPYSAECPGTRFSFGRFYDYENFVIALRSMFVPTDELTKLLELLKKVSSVNSVDLEDDGITQKVTAQQGSRLAKDVSITPIRKLKPFRTFLEVEQPESEFLFRVKDNTFALFEADGGAWKITAKASIQRYLFESLESEMSVGKIVLL